MPEKLPAVYLAWILIQAAGVVLLLGRILPFPLPWLESNGWFAGLAAAETALVILIWPGAAPPVARGIRGACAALLQGGALALLAVPLLAPSLRISQGSAMDLITALVSIFAWAVLGSGLAAWGRARRGSLPLVQAVLLLLALLPPWIAFLGVAHGAGDFAALIWISPVWGAVRGGGLALAQGVAAALLGFALAATAPEAAA